MKCLRERPAQQQRRSIRIKNWNALVSRKSLGTVRAHRLAMRADWELALGAVFVGFLIGVFWAPPQCPSWPLVNWDPNVLLGDRIHGVNPQIAILAKNSSICFAVDYCSLNAAVVANRQGQVLGCLWVILKVHKVQRQRLRRIAHNVLVMHDVRWHDAFSVEVDWLLVLHVVSDEEAVILWRELKCLGGISILQEVRPANTDSAEKEFIKSAPFWKTAATALNGMTHLTPLGDITALNQVRQPEVPEVERHAEGTCTEAI